MNALDQEEAVRFSIASLFVLSLLAGPAMGSDNTNAHAILSQQASIQADAVARKGRYKDMSEADLQSLLQHQAVVNAKLGQVEKTTELREADQIAVFNALEAIEAIINRAEDERLVCERYKPVGSNRPTTVCKTVAQRRAEREIVENMPRDQRCVDAWNAGFCRN